MRFDLKHFDLGIDREIETIEYYVEFNFDSLTICSHCYSKRYPDTKEGEIGEPTDRFISFEQIIRRDVLLGVEIYWSIWDEKSEQDEFSHWIIEFYTSSSQPQAKVRFKDEVQARKFFKIAKDYLLKRFIH